MDVKLSIRDCMVKAREAGTVIPAFNIPYLPMMEPVVRALRDADAFGLIQVARLEWEKFQSGSLKAIRDEYERQKDERHTRLHLDHVPVIDEDQLRVDYRPIFTEAIELGYESIMVDGSRLDLDENASVTAEVVALGHEAGIPVEAELGAVLGHEAGPLPPYEELFATGKGFTDTGEAREFMERTGVDWLSVAVGNIHGAVSEAARDQKKVQARLNIEHLDRLREVCNVPLVLHGGSGIEKASILAGVRHGIAKINIGTAIRQPYEVGAGDSVETGQANVYRATLAILDSELEIRNGAGLFA